MVTPKGLAPWNSRIFCCFGPAGCGAGEAETGAEGACRAVRTRRARKEAVRRDGCHAGRSLLRCRIAFARSGSPPTPRVDMAKRRSTPSLPVPGI